MARVTHAVPPRERARRAVARDTATILSGAAIALALAQLAGLTNPVAIVSSPTPAGSEEVIGVASVGAVPTLPGLATIGPIVNASAGLDATPTPIPIITLGPPSPSPSESPRTSPGATPRITPRPTVKPSIKPSGSLPPPPLVVDFTCDQPTGTYTAAVSGTCTAVVTGAVGTVSYAWSADVSPGAPGLATFTFDTNGDYSISLSITDGLGRSAGPASQCCWSVTVAASP
ncbi:MAG TPA: hypothetical protein VGI98_02720 [Candidatus Limnocylindrales bacterium]|jgi:hypothetical protein